MPKTPKKPAIKYTSRDFQSIREDLLNYAKQYYPTTYKDFNEASFGSLMMDTVAYVGDILSFYLDYQANESFLSTAIEYENVWKLARQSGYRAGATSTSTGLLTFYVLIPVTTVGTGPDTNYMPFLKRGSKFSSTTGNVFTLLEDVDFKNSDNQVVVANVNSTTGVPTSFAVRAKGRIISGELAVEEKKVGPFERFRKVELNAQNVSEIVSVVDDLGKDYLEVDYLSQDVVFVPVINTGDNRDTAPNIMRPVSVPRRFTVESEPSKTILQFGYGQEGERLGYLEPNKVVLDQHGRDHIVDTSFDPVNLIGNDKMGIAPANTTLTIVYRINTSENSNAVTNSIKEVVDPRFEFPSQETLTPAKVASVVSSLEAINEEPIIGNVSELSSEELRVRAIDSYASQNRAVTKQDYESLTYRMPKKFGAIKRAALVQDTDSLRRNLNLYVVSEDYNGKLIATNQTIKENLKTWINHYKMINDTVDILDSKIANFGIQFKAISEPGNNKYDLLTAAVTRIKEGFIERSYNIGEAISKSDILFLLKQVPGILDVVDVEIINKSGGAYSDLNYDIEDHTSLDGRYILAEENIIFEIKYPDADIKGTIV
jgi:uncharacterized protein YajQ (UPF0234 family)